MRIYLVRHGQDDDNYRGGWSNRGLIEEGTKQAKLLASFLCKNRENYSISKIISSDLERTVETTRELKDILNVPVEYSSDWREMNNGELAGMDNKEALERYPGLFYNTLDMNERYPEGESPIEFYNRIKSSFEYLCNNISMETEKDNIMIVTHGGVIEVLYYILNNYEWTNKSPNLCKTSTTGIHMIEYIDGNWKIVMSNNIEHLQYN
ncbi:histidine phosphatase family protein [Clostridium sp. UBA1056]|uniref:histidine phosphatase family protein n=1 Tax=unclassified Clostridium TaxID=2614128 RepID=UPI003217F8A0